MASIPSLPASLLLPPHLSAHKYFFVCTLTVAAWDTLVLSPRTIRLMKTDGWPPLKILFHLLRYLMPVEFVIVAVAFFDTGFSASMCEKFYLFEPIVSAILVTASAVAVTIRLSAIFDHSRAVLGGLSALVAAQAVVMTICCAFYRPMPLLPGQGCVAGPKENWVGVYWLAPTLFFTTAFGLAVARSVKSLQSKSLGIWKLMLRDGLNLYAAIWLVNMVNVLFWFIASPTGPADTIKTTVTSMATVLTTTMTLRIILSVRGSLAQGGAYSGTQVSATGSRPSHASNTLRSNLPTAPTINISKSLTAPTYSIDAMQGKPSELDQFAERKVDLEQTEGAPRFDYTTQNLPRPPVGVKVTIDREVDYRRY